jgi:site-specific recombinase XerD
MILTTCQAANILNINENTLNALVSGGQIPHLSIKSGNGQKYYFNTKDIRRWLRQGLSLNQKTPVASLKHKKKKQFSQELEDLHKYDKQFITPRRGKGYNLTKVKNKKLGFVYHVRYIDKGKLVPTRWSTHTNNEDAAVDFALSNREKLLSEYHKRKLPANANGNLYNIMRNYYKKNSQYSKKDALRGRTLSDNTRQTYHNAIINHWVPFLKKNGIKTVNEIDTPLLANFQDSCLDCGNKPQTVNHYISHISKIFDHLLIRGKVKTNPCKSLEAIKVSPEDQKITGCPEAEKIKGAFNKRWNNSLSYILCLLIYTTNMRNIEIERIQVKDLIKIKNINFIDIPQSKTKNGTRIVPLHNFVYRKLMAYIRGNKIGTEDYIFKSDKRKRLNSYICKKAYTDLTKYSKYTTDEFEKENIKFYSGRHFWKTLMNANDLGDVEEYFMGHKISNDVAKRYNHRDKHGQNKIVEKAKQVFKILDRKLFIRQSR